MRKSTENQDKTRTQNGEYFSPRSKVKSLALQEHLSTHLTSFNQETPMKPSQVPNRLSLPPPRRVLPLLSPELCYRDRLSPTWQPPHALGQICSTEFILGSSTNVGTSTHRPHHMPRDRLGPPLHSAQHNSFCSSQLVPGSQSYIDTTAKRLQLSPPGINPHGSPHFMKDLNNHSWSSNIKGHQETEPMVILSYSGNNNVTARSHELHKAQSSNVRGPMPTVQLHRPPVTPSLNTSAQQKVYQPPFLEFERLTPGNSQCPAQGHQLSPSTESSERSSVCSLPNMHSPIAPYQDQQLKQTPSNGKPIPAVDSNCSSQKRYREFEGSDDNPKKLCLQGPNSAKAQTPKPIDCSSGSTSLATSSRQPSLELPPETTDSHLCLEPACGRSTCLELPSTLKPTQSSCASLSPKPCVRQPPSAGAKQAYINSSNNHIVKIKSLKSPTKSDEDGLKKISKENDKRIKSSTLSSDVPRRDTSNLPHVQHGSHHSGHSHRSTFVLSAKTSSKANQGKDIRKMDSSAPKSASKPTSDPLRCRTAERRKTSRLRRPAVIPDDVDELFTPDPLTYIVSPGQKNAKSKTDGETIKLSPSEKSCSSSTVSTSSTSVTRSTGQKTLNFKATGSSHAMDTKVSYSAINPQVSQPSVALHRVKLENIMFCCSKDSELKNSPTISSSRQLKEESVKSGDKHLSCLPNKVTSVADTAASQHTSTSSSQCSQSLSLRRQTSEVSRKQASEEDPIDVELDLGLSFALDFDVTQSSHSSEEEQLLSLQEMMERVTKPPDTPEKGAFSEPSTPGHRSCQPLQSTTKPGNYKNNLDQMLKEINTNKKAKEIETQLLTACQEDLLRIAEYEEAEENQEEEISTEQQEFLQRYSLMSNAIREVPPGEVVFNLEKFGQIFNQDTLQLRKCMVNPQGTAQKTLLWSSPAQLRLHVNIGLFQEAYNCRSPCPSQVTRFLFKMMSVHSERMVSEKILQALCDIACTAAFQIVKNGSQQFKVWVPSLADVTLVLMNMGIAFVTLFPFENLQPPFTEGDLLEDIYIDRNSPSSNKEQSAFPEHNCNSILKYLSYCMGLCPRAYSDNELLLLLTVVGRVALDSRLILQSSVELYPLQYKIINNIRDWDTMLPKICLALTDLTDDHHNMCLVVQLLPDNTRGKQLRRHLSLSMISKLLDGNCTYRPAEKEFQLSMLRPYLPCMQPSTLLRSLLRNQKDKEEDMATLDQQSYYLCYSLLTLANEASNFQFFPAHQKKQLLHLCSELETHVKCDIRESEKCLYRSKVKDLVARIYTKWQMLLQRTRPLNGKLYDYWQPLPMDTLLSSQEEEHVTSSDDGEDTVMTENPVMEEDQQEEKTNEAEDEAEATASNEVEDKEEETGELEIKLQEEERREEKERDNPMDEKNETEEAIEPLSYINCS